jgi:hypothetical protein
MGVSIAWLAVKTHDPRSLYESLQVRPAGQPDEHCESPICGSALNGWFLLIARRCNHRIVGDEFLADFSRSRDVVACSVEEHVMVSSAAGWRDGRCTWSIVHDAQEGMLNLTTSGEPPEVFPQIRAELLAQQEAEGGTEAEVDLIFDIPLQVAKSIVGFKHDENTEWTDQTTFEAYQDTRKPWWKFW